MGALGDPIDLVEAGVVQGAAVSRQVVAVPVIGVAAAADNAGDGMGTGSAFPVAVGANTRLALDVAAAVVGDTGGGAARHRRLRSGAEHQGDDAVALGDGLYGAFVGCDAKIQVVPLVRVEQHPGLVIGCNKTGFGQFLGIVERVFAEGPEPHRLDEVLGIEERPEVQVIGAVLDFAHRRIFVKGSLPRAVPGLFLAGWFLLDDPYPEQVLPSELHEGFLQGDGDPGCGLYRDTFNGIDMGGNLVHLAEWHEDTPPLPGQGGLDDQPILLRHVASDPVIGDCHHGGGTPGIPIHLLYLLLSLNVSVEILQCTIFPCLLV